MGAAGGQGLGYSMAAALALVAGWGVLRMRRRAATATPEKRPFTLQPAVPVGTTLAPEALADVEAQAKAAA
jgi:hypothetical protein